MTATLTETCKNCTVQIMFQRLQDWQDRTGIDDDALAKIVNVNRTTIDRAKRGLYVLRFDTQLALKELTGISPAEWAEHFEITAPLRVKEPKDKEREPVPVGEGAGA